MSNMNDDLMMLMHSLKDMETFPLPKGAKPAGSVYTHDLFRLSIDVLETMGNAIANEITALNGNSLIKGKNTSPNAHRINELEHKLQLLSLVANFLYEDAKAKERKQTEQQIKATKRQKLLQALATVENNDLLSKDVDTLRQELEALDQS